MLAPMFESEHIQTNDLIEKISPTRFRWKGRLDFAIETGGIKVIPEEIEEILSKHIHARFFVSSLPDAALNNRVVLIVEGNKQDLPTNIFDELPPYHQPKEVFFIDEFVETTSGKIDRLSSAEKIND